jgi:hypothetical protein
VVGVAQGLERLAVAQEAAGSKPVTHPNIPYSNFSPESSNAPAIPGGHLIKSRWVISCCCSVHGLSGTFSCSNVEPGSAGSGTDGNDGVGGGSADCVNRGVEGADGSGIAPDVTAGTATGGGGLLPPAISPETGGSRLRGR